MQKFFNENSFNIERRMHSHSIFNKKSREDDKREHQKDVKKNKLFCYVNGKNGVMNIKCTYIYNINPFIKKEAEKEGRLKVFHFPKRISRH